MPGRSSLILGAFRTFPVNVFSAREVPESELGQGRRAEIWIRFAYAVFGGDARSFTRAMNEVVCMASHDQNIFPPAAARSYLLLFNNLTCWASCQDV